MLPKNGAEGSADGREAPAKKRRGRKPKERAAATEARPSVERIVEFDEGEDGSRRTRVPDSGVIPVQEDEREEGEPA